MPPHHRRHLPSSAIGSFIRPAEIERLLEPYVPGAEDRAYVVRCILDAGPAHHRGANQVLLTLLGKVLERLPPAAAKPAAPEAPVPLRLPPHERSRHAEEDDVFPLGVPLAPLDRLAPRGSREQAAMIDCLTDGPPQHSLANAAMVHLLGDILDRLG